MFKKKNLIFASLVVVIGISLLILNKPSSKQGAKERVFGKISRDSFIIPLILPMQGNNSSLGESALKGARLAVELVNKQGGILGHPLELLVGDSRSSASLAAELTKDFIAKNHKLIIGGIAQEETLSILENSKDAFVFYLSDGIALTCSKDDPLKLNTRVWGMGITPQMQTETFLISLSDKFRKPEDTFEIYLYGNTSENQSAYLTEIAEGLEFKICGQDYVDTRVSDLFQRVRKIFDHKPDLLLFFTEETGTEKFITHAHKLSLRTEMTVATTNSINQGIATKLGELTDGIWTTTTYSSEINSEDNKKFIASWKSFFNDDSIPTSTSIKAYTAIKVIQEALLKSGDIEITGLEKGLENLELKLPQGEVVVSSTNHLLIQPLYLSQLEKGKFAHLELLGDASHPALEGCTFEIKREQSKQPLAIPEDY